MAATVVLLHGLGRTRHSLRRLKRRLDSDGWEIWSRTYASRRQSIMDSADQVAHWIEMELPDRELFVVTHSMGGIIARMLAHRCGWQGCVMVAPPNQVPEPLDGPSGFRGFHSCSVRR